MILVYSLLLPLVAVVLASGLARPLRLPRIVFFLPALGTFILLSLAPVGTSLLLSWVPEIGMEFSLRLGGLGKLLALLVSGVGSLIVLYAAGYMSDEAEGRRLISLLYLFMFAMLGVALSEHLLLLFMFWELTSISSYLLIGFHHEDAVSRRNALQALLVTGLGGMALLAGLILMANACGTWRISELTGVQGHVHYPAILSLILLGAFTKSAQFPFHFWLPNAMAAPTPVSAYLHSATMVKAGIFLLALFLPVLGGTPAWTWSLCTAGGITLLLGGVFGLRQHDLKALLAGTTLGVLGLLTLLLGIGTPKAVLGALTLFLAHALYKAALFMTAGAVDHATHTRDLRQLGGLRKAMPWTFAAVLLAGASKMGFPPFLGFIAKETLYKAGLATSSATLLVTIMVLGNVLIVALAAKYLWIPFLSAPSKAAEHAHEAPWCMRMGPLLLAGLGLIAGLLPGWSSSLLSPALSTCLGTSKEASLHLWTGVNLPLILSGLTLLAGFLLARFQIRRAVTRDSGAVPGDRSYDRMLNAILAFARWQTQQLQSGILRRYLIIILLSTAALIAIKIFRSRTLPPVSFHDATFLVAAVCIMMMVSSLVAVMTSNRLTAIVALGMVGFGVALLFAMFSAPDLAITQILVETLTVVFFAWAVRRLPRFHGYSTDTVIHMDALLSAFAGLMVTILILSAQAVPHDSALAEQLTAWSLSKAYGSNVVNVILVDFRALDTFGEIAVLAIAALGVFALLDGGSGVAAQEPSPAMQATLLRIATRYLSPLLLILSVGVLYRGHNLPGGGFIGGLVAASAFLLMVLGRGWARVLELLRIGPGRILFVGLLIAALSSLPGFLVGGSLFGAEWLPAFNLPVLGKIKLGTPVLFDIGVYFAVLGFVLQSAKTLSCEEEL